MILHAAKVVFAREGYHYSTVSQIAREAGIGDGTVYLYFENKEDILKKLFHQAIYHDFVPQAEQNVINVQEPPLQLYELVRTHFAFFNNDFELARVIQVESRQSNPSVKEAMKAGMHRYFRLIESIVVKGQEQQYFRQDVSPRMMRKVIFGSMDEVVTCWVLGNNKYSLMSKVEEAYKLLHQSVINLPYLCDLPWTFQPRNRSEAGCSRERRELE